MKILKLIRYMILVIVCFFGAAQGAAVTFNSVDEIIIKLKTKINDDKIKEVDSVAKKFLDADDSWLGGFFGSNPEYKKNDLKQKLTTEQERISPHNLQKIDNESTIQQGINLFTNLNNCSQLKALFPKIDTTITIPATGSHAKILIRFLAWCSALQQVLNDQLTFVSASDTYDETIKILTSSSTPDSKSTSGTTVVSSKPVIGRVSSSDDLLKSEPAATPPLSPRIQPRDESTPPQPELHQKHEPATAPHASRKTKTAKELKEKKEQLKKVITDAQQELDDARQAALDKKNAAIKLAQERLGSVDFSKM